MLNQREMDIALVEAKVETQKLLEEWAKDYLGSRLDGIDTRRGGVAEGSGTQAAEGSGIPQEEIEAY